MRASYNSALRFCNFTPSRFRSELEAAGMSPADIALIAPQKVFDGNRPSNSILFPVLTPRALGKLIALYVPHALPRKFAANCDVDVLCACTSTRSSARGLCGASTRSTNGELSWAR